MANFLVGGLLVTEVVHEFKCGQPMLGRYVTFQHDDGAGGFLKVIIGEIVFFMEEKTSI